MSFLHIIISPERRMSFTEYGVAHTRRSGLTNPRFRNSALKSHEVARADRHKIPKELTDTDTEVGERRGTARTARQVQFPAVLKLSLAITILTNTVISVMSSRNAKEK